MHSIRPHKLFSLVQSTSYLDRMVQVVLPDKETPVFFDTAILLALAKLVRPRTIFEFGTYIGVQTLNLAINFPDAHVYTLDLDQKAVQDSAGGSNSSSAANLKARFGTQEREVLTHLEFQDRLAFLNTPYMKRITCLYGDSNQYDFSDLVGQMDVVYIDGGHDPETLESDTKNALSILSQSRAACVAWHDCGNPRYTHIMEYLRNLPHTNDMSRIDTTLTTSRRSIKTRKLCATGSF